MQAMPFNFLRMTPWTRGLALCILDLLQRPLSLVVQVITSSLLLSRWENIYIICLTPCLESTLSGDAHLQTLSHWLLWHYLKQAHIMHVDMFLPFEATLKQWSTVHWLIINDWWSTDWWTTNGKSITDLKVTDRLTNILNF